IDWCQYDVTTGEGLWTYVQIIKVLDDTGPVFMDCPGSLMTLCVEDEGVSLPDYNQLFLGEGHPDATSCGAHVTIEHEVNETCSGTVLYDVKLYLYDGPDYIQVLGETEAATDSNDIATLVFDSRVSPDLDTRLYGIPYNNNLCSGGPKDYHRILWTVEDGCGNQSTCSYLLRVEDCKKPTPVCVGLQSVVMPSSGSVTIWASDFNASSVDDCTPADELLFSFSGTEYMLGMEFNCELIEANGSPSFIIEIWAADAGVDENCDGQISWAERNKDFCTTFIVIDDNENVCPGSGSIGGDVHTEEFEPVEGVRMNMMDELGLVMQTYITGSNGTFQFFNPLLSYSIDAYRNDNHKNGVSSLDLVRIQKHLLGIEPFTSPYKRIAADANNSESISAIDLVEIRKVILGVNLEFPDNTSWRFVDADFVFTDPEQPWPYDEMIELDNLTVEENFVAIKIGDVNGTVVANANQVETRNPVGVLNLQVEDQIVRRGERLVVPVYAQQFANMIGYQFTLRTTGLVFEAVNPGAIDINMENFGVHSGAITTSWHSARPVSVEKGEVLFELVFNPKADATLRELLSIGSRITSAEAYQQADGQQPLDLDVTLTFCDPCQPIVSNPVGVDYALYQNEPNPVGSETRIGFSLPYEMAVSLTLFDVNGTTIRQFEGVYEAGYHEISINFHQGEVGGGVLYYRLQAEDFSATKKMIILRK
ncbi:MAG: dockerin type I domain-containing protein, partial [Saprospiraceae bacterium]|nr:dockerin type I domain-containing protein [Saprospiraceae bacterium]